MTFIPNSGIDGERRAERPVGDGAAAADKDQLGLFPVHGLCPACDGRGWFSGLFGDEPGLRPRCGMCDGTGWVVSFNEKRR